LSDDEIRSYISLVLIAGGETTDANLANLFTLLIEHPEQFQAVYEDRSLVHDAIAEQLRFLPSNHMIMRVTGIDLELSGTIIPAGSTVACMLAAGNRDPRKFDRPDEFDIFRTDNDTARAFRGSADHLAFGDGRHFCAGAMFAREAMTTATNLILDRMASPPRFPPGFTPQFVGIWVRQPTEVLLEFEPTGAPAG
jgi:cytochrome P450